MAVTNYLWDMVNDNVLAETDDNGEVTAEYTYEPDHFGNFISQQRDGAQSFYHFDGQGSTRVLTDENADVTDAYEYNAFGEVTSRTGDTTNPFGYKGALGYYANPETNDYYVRARSYEPTIGRWKSVDPLGMVDQTNRYAYVSNAPVKLIDPSGLWQSVGETIYESDQCHESLEDLAEMVSGDRSDWVCIWPQRDDALWHNYPSASIGARADVKNLVATEGADTRELKIMPTIGPISTDGYLLIVRFMLNNDRRGGRTSHWVDGANAARIIRNASREGRSPIRWMVVGGHCGGGVHLGNFRGRRLFQASDLAVVATESDNSQNSYATALAEKGPPKCWFTKSSHVWGVGCNTNTWATDWASKVLRRGSTAHGTTAFVWGTSGGGRRTTLYFAETLPDENDPPPRPIGGAGNVAADLSAFLVLRGEWMTATGTQ